MNRFQREMALIEELGLAFGAKDPTPARHGEDAIPIRGGLG